VLQEGGVVGLGASLAIVAVTHLAGPDVAPGARQALNLSLVCVGQLVWAVRRPERPAIDGAIVAAIAATMAGLTIRLGEWVHRRIDAAANRRAVGALEAARPRCY
jgi:uncharacterized membrane protein YfcA